MAIYNYMCPTCETLYEISKPMSESDKEEDCCADIMCEGHQVTCGATLERVYMNQGGFFKLKGEGWTGRIKQRR